MLCSDGREWCRLWVVLWIASFFSGQLIGSHTEVDGTQKSLRKELAVINVTLHSRTLIK